MIPIALYKDKRDDSKLYYQEKNEEWRPSEKTAERHRCDTMKA